MKHFLRHILLEIILPISMFFLTIISQAQSGSSKKPYWEYVRTESGVFPYSPDGCYKPTVHKAEEGLVEITVTKCFDPNDKVQVRTRLRFEWTQPPRIIYPGESYPYKLTTTLIENSDPNWVIGGSIWMRAEIVTNEGPYPGWAGGAEAAFGKGSPKVVVLDNLQRDANNQEKGPPIWWATNSNPPNMIRLSFVSSFSNQHWWAYIYRYVEPSQSNTDMGGAGYQLYFDGKLVSGPDAAYYTRGQAEQNCRWNMQNNSNHDIRCVYNGATFAEWKKSSDDKQSSNQISKTWSVLEKVNGNGQYWEATWRLREDGRSFDGHWKVFPSGQEGDLTNFARIKTIQNNQIIVERPGLGTYQGKISSDGRNIKGTLSWCSTCIWEVKFDTPLPSELR